MSNTIKTFNEYLTEQQVTEEDLRILTEGLQEEWTDELEAKVDAALEEFIIEYSNENGELDINRFNFEVTNEGMLGSIFGGLAGFALGKTVGKMIAKVLGIQKGILYDLLTSRLVGAALGSALGKRI
jgi:hypothetical protein